MLHPKNIRIEDFDYLLPDERIAKFPLPERDSSKLLVAENENIKLDIFSNIADYLPKNSLLLLNNTRVVQARLKFRKETGSEIEVFCLEPLAPVQDVQLAFQVKNSCEWKCLVGGVKRWKSGKLFIKDISSDIEISVEKFGEIDNTFRIRFEWNKSEMDFADIIHLFGKIPLPPYIKREVEESDSVRYQTIYAENKGSVASPTAGLHFTEKVFKSLQERNIQPLYISLHIGAGTFKPVSSDTIEGHVMHSEQIVITKSLVERLLENHQKKLISVGTTSCRSIESLYWYGQMLETEKTVDFNIPQWMPYETDENHLVTKQKALQNVLNKMQDENLNEIHGSTQIIIAPGYQFKMVNHLITNLHQPKSTLLLLISAFYKYNWKEIYNFAMKNNFRFLSYGDSCLFLGE